jgi:hypothetical protein
MPAAAPTPPAAAAANGPIDPTPESQPPGLLSKLRLEEEEEAAGQDEQQQHMSANEPSDIFEAGRWLSMRSCVVVD